MRICPIVNCGKSQSHWSILKSWNQSSCCKSIGRLFGFIIVARSRFFRAEMNLHTFAAHGDLEPLKAELMESSRLARYPAIRLRIVSSRVSGAQDSGPATVNSCNRHGFTALHAACWHGQEECAKALLDHGAYVNCPSKYPRSTFPLHLAVIRMNRAIIRLLLVNYGADPALRDFQGMTALDAAAELERETEYDEASRGLTQFVRDTILEARRGKSGKKPYAYDSYANLRSTSLGSSTNLQNHQTSPYEANQKMKSESDIRDGKFNQAQNL
jgi:hypothetical protein